MSNPHFGPRSLSMAAAEEQSGKGGGTGPGQTTQQRLPGQHCWENSFRFKKKKYHACALRHADNCPDVRPQLAQAHELWLLLFCSPLASTRFLLATRRVQEKAVWGPSFGWAGPETSRRAALHHPTFLTVRIIVSALSRTSFQ